MTLSYRADGGPLLADEWSYVPRKADEELLDYLGSGTLCYVCNARQMGKTSLWTRTEKVLESKGKYICASVSLDEIGCGPQSEESKWYNSIIKLINRKLQVFDASELEAFYSENQRYTPPTRFNLFLEEALTTQQKHIVIAIDEIDGILEVPFEKNNFFKTIRSFHSRPPSQYSGNRLNFVLIGVVSPYNLGEGKQGTPFNIGGAIDLGGISLEDALPILSPGLEGLVNNPKIVLSQILHWTGGQPFLTQKACNIIQNAAEDSPVIQLRQHELIDWVDQLIQTEFIENWKTTDDPPHFREIQHYLVRDDTRSARFLDLYAQILENQSILDEGNEDCIELRLSGLVYSQEGNLYVRNNIYTQIFTEEWINFNLSMVRQRGGYQVALAEWQHSGESPDFLLTGNDLTATATWANLRVLPRVDERFIKLSQEHARKTAAEQEAEARANLQKVRKLTWLTTASAIGTGTAAFILMLVARGQSSAAREAAALTEQKQEELEIANADLKETQRQQQQLKDTIDNLEINLAQKEGALQDTQIQLDDTQEEKIKIEGELNQERDKLTITNEELTATQTTLKTAEENLGIAKVDLEDAVTQTQIAQKNAQKAQHATKIAASQLQVARTSTVLVNESRKALQQFESNQLEALERATELAIELKQLSNTRNINIDNLEVTEPIQVLQQILLRINEKVRIPVSQEEGFGFSPEISPTNKHFLVRKFTNESHLDKSHFTPKTDVRTIEGELIFTIENAVHSKFSPDGNWILTTGFQGNAHIWDLNGNLISEIPLDPNGSYAKFSPNGKHILTTSYEGINSIWDINGNLIQEFNGKNQIYNVFSSDGELIVTGSPDGIVRIWHINGALLNQFEVTADIISIDLSSTGELIAVGSSDGIGSVWNIHGDSIALLNHEEGPIYSIKFHQDSHLIMTSNYYDLHGNERYFDTDITTGNSIIWDTSGNKILDLPNQNIIQRQAYPEFGPDGIILNHHSPRNIALTDINNEESIVLPHESVHAIDLSPNADYIVSASNQSISIWNLSKTEKGIKLNEKYSETINEDISHPFLFPNDGQDIIINFTYNNFSEQTLAKAINVFDLSGNRVLDIQKLQGSPFNDEFMHLLIFNKISHDGLYRIVNLVGNNITIHSSSGELLSTFPRHPEMGDALRILGFSKDGKRVILYDERIEESFIYIYSFTGELINKLLFPPSADSNSSEIISMNFAKLIYDERNEYLVVPVAEDVDSLSQNHFLKVYKVTENSIDLLTTQQSISASSDSNTNYNLIGYNMGSDGKFFSTYDTDGVVKIWNIDGTLHSEIRSQYQTVHTHFSPDNQFIITNEYNSGETSVGFSEVYSEIWTISGNLIAQFDKQAKFTQDGKYLTLLSSNGFLQEIPFENLDQLIFRACDYMYNNFSFNIEINQDLINQCQQLNNSDLSNLESSHKLDSVQESSNSSKVLSSSIQQITQKNPPSKASLVTQIIMPSQIGISTPLFSNRNITTYSSIDSNHTPSSETKTTSLGRESFYDKRKTYSGRLINHSYITETIS